MKRLLGLLALAMAVGASEVPRTAIAAAERGDWPAVVTACARDFDRAAADERLWTLYGRAAIETNDLRLAAVLVEGALVRFPASDDARQLELSLYARARRPAELLRASTAWLDRHPQDADAWLARAWAAREVSDGPGACASLEAAVLLRPDDQHLRRQFADQLRSQGLPRAALPHYRRLAELPGCSDDLRLAAATCAGEAGDPRLGMTWLTIAGNPAKLLLARLAIQAGDETAAATALDAVLAAGEHDPRVLTWAGRLADQRGDLARAEACYAQAAETADGGLATLLLADLYRRTHRSDDAVHLLERHLASHPGDTAAKALLGSLRQH